MRHVSGSGAVTGWRVVVLLAAVLLAVVVALGRWDQQGAAAGGESVVVAAPQTLVQQSAVATTPSGDIAGPVRVRPSFVSPLEWQVLQGLAAQATDPAARLTHLVNNLRFAKREAQWRESDRPEERLRLAALLLPEVPVRVAAGDMDASAAQLLQRELLTLLEPDPAVRARRIGEEAKKLPTLLHPSA